jgi:5-methylcytosine-specific restriction endonuclease McrA
LRVFNTPLKNIGKKLLKFLKDYVIIVYEQGVKMGNSTQEYRKDAKKHYHLRNKRTVRVMNGELQNVLQEENVESEASATKVEEWLTLNEKKIKAKKAIKKMPYKKYIVSKAWKERRQLLLETQGTKCEMCGHDHQKAKHVHHNNYKTRGEEKDSDLMVLCPDCHNKFHETGKVATNRLVSYDEYRCCMCAWMPVVHVESSDGKARSLKFCINCFSTFMPELSRSRRLQTAKVTFYHHTEGLKRT